MKTSINIVNVSKSYGTNVLLDDVNLLIEEKSKIGVIGRNGAGKTTLIKMLMGLEEPDSGEIIISPEVQVGYLRQDDDFDLDENVIDHLSRITGAEKWRCAKIASRFGIDHNKSTFNIGKFSSGFRMRIKLTEMMLNEPNFLLLDEPSNFLDLNTLIDLENFLLDYNGGFLIISHDREFLKSTCEKTLEVGKGGCTYFPSGIEDFFEYKNEQIESTKRYNKNVDDKKAHLQKFVDKFGSKASKAKQAQSKMKQIEKLKTIEVGNPLKNVKIHIPHVVEKKGFAVVADELSIGYNGKEICKSQRIEIPRGVHVAVLGENGEGKTTLLRTLAGELEKVDGNFNYSQGIKLAYFAEHIYKNLTANDNVLSYLRRHAKPGILTRELQAMLGSFLFSNDDIYKDVSVLSGGEKSRLTLLAAISQCADILLLDEPTNHLDFETVEALGYALRNYKGTIFFTSHDRTFVSLLADSIIEVKAGKFDLYSGDYNSYVYNLRVKAIEAEEINKEEEKKEQDIKNKEKESTNVNGSYGERKKIKSQISKARNSIKSHEKQIEVLKQEELSILDFFDNGNVYDEEKSVRIKEIKNTIHELEVKWVKLHEELEKVSVLIN